MTHRHSLLLLGTSASVSPPAPRNKCVCAYKFKLELAILRALFLAGSNRGFSPISCKGCLSVLWTGWWRIWPEAGKLCCREAVLKLMSYLWKQRSSSLPVHFWITGYFPSLVLLEDSSASVLNTIFFLKLSLYWGVTDLGSVRDYISADREGMFSISDTVWGCS